MSNGIDQNEWDTLASEREDPNATKPPAQEAPPEQTVAEEAKPEVDPYEGLHPEVQAKLKQFDQLAATLPDLVTGLKEAKGRIGALQSEWSKAKSAPGPSQTQITAAARDPEKWASLKEDFPEWGEGITEYVEARIGQLTGAGLSAEQIEQMVAARAGEQTAQVERLFSERLIEFKHAGWKQTVNSPEFGEWLAAQPESTKALANSTDPMDAISMLDGFAAHKAKPVAAVQQDRKQRLQQAVTTTKAGQAPVTKSFEQMSPAEQWEYLASQRNS